MCPQRQAAFEMYEDPMSLFSGVFAVEEEQAAQEVPSGLDCFPQGKQHALLTNTSCTFSTDLQRSRVCFRRWRVFGASADSLQ